MNHLRKLIATFAFSLLVIGVPAIASAQWRNDRNDDDYYGNRNAVALSYAVKNLNNSSKRFADLLDRELDRSRIDGSAREDNLNRLAKRFKDAADDLDDKFDSRRNTRNSSDEARRVLDAATQLDRALTRSRVGRNQTISNNWNGIEKDLITIARAYNYRYNGSYGNNGRYGNDTDWGGNGRDNRNLRATIVNLRNNAKKFEKRVNREFDDRRNGRWGSGNNLEDLAHRFKDATERLEDSYDNRRDYNQSSDEVRDVLNVGQQISRSINRSGASSALRSDWNRIEQDLRVLSNSYNSGYGRNPRGGNFPF